MNASLRHVLLLSLALLAGLAESCVVWAEEEDADDTKAEDAPASPNVYIDFNATFASVPGTTFSLGFSGSSTRLSTQPSKSIAFNPTLTVDLSDQVSVYAGVSGVTSKVAGSSWTPVDLSSWNVGFSADVIQQNGLLPMVTFQSTITRTIQASVFGQATSGAVALELNYATDEDQTRGFLAGVKHTQIFPDSTLVNIKPITIGYIGGYYQWSNNWQIYTRAGVQFSGGADITRLIHVPSIKGPIAQFEFNKVDDKDNRLFGITAEIAWVPKPVFQLILHTPLYFIRS